MSGKPAAAKNFKDSRYAVRKHTDFSGTHIQKRKENKTKKADQEVQKQISKEVQPIESLKKEEKNPQK